MTVGLTVCLLVFSLTCGLGNQDPSLFMISLTLVSFVSLLVLAYVIYALVAGVFALKGCNLKSRLIYSFIQD
jgi:hypothetical protein